VLEDVVPERDDERERQEAVRDRRPEGAARRELRVDVDRLPVLGRSRGRSLAPRR
jgi:hypothetical protein